MVNLIETLRAALEKRLEAFYRENILPGSFSIQTTYHRSPLGKIILTGNLIDVRIKLPEEWQPNKETLALWCKYQRAQKAKERLYKRYRNAPTQEHATKCLAGETAYTNALSAWMEKLQTLIPLREERWRLQD